MRECARMTPELCREQHDDGHDGRKGCEHAKPEKEDSEASGRGGAEVSHLPDTPVANRFDK